MQQPSDETQGEVAAREMSREELITFCNANSFCHFITFTKTDIYISHINLISDGNLFFGHLSAANQHSKHLKEGNVIAIFKDSASQKYVHLQGEISAIDNQAELIFWMNKLITKYESSKPNPWTVQWQETKFSEQLKGIIGFKVIPTKLEILANNRPTMNFGAASHQHSPTLFNFAPLYIPERFGERRQEHLVAGLKAYPRCVLLIRSHRGELLIHHVDLTVQSEENQKLILGGKINLGESFECDTRKNLTALAIFFGPHTYISPNWYKTLYSVPTWNYMAIHVYGEVRMVGSIPIGREGMAQLELEVFRLEGKFKFNQNRSLEDRAGVINHLHASPAKEDQEVGKLMEKIGLCSQ